MYDFRSVEGKWQAVWARRRVFETSAPSDNDKKIKPKYYVLEMFPYPTGTMHLGHIRAYTVGDALARYKRASGYDVLHPMGWDCFGLPAENAALKHRTHPATWVYSNMAYLKRQFERMGWLYDWRREVATCSPDYYRWEQLLFIQMYKRGLAYRRHALVSWCPACRTTLADEQGAHGCWRCGATAERHEGEHWFFKVTPYAQSLLEGLENLSDWPTPIVTMQRDWIENRLSDWAVSRERYWGVPIPIVHCPSCGAMPVSEDDLPVILPEDLENSDEPQPLAKNAAFLKTNCPQCQGPARRETSTLDTLVDSSWYYARFCSVGSTTQAFAREDALRYLPVDQYIGGAEHATMHLLYIRYMHRVLQDLGWVPREVGEEPALRLLNQGPVLRNGERMSKSGGNIVDPEALLKTYGADALRLYALFVAPPEKPVEWSEEALAGAHRFLARVERLIDSNLSLVRDVACYAGPHEGLAHPEARRLRTQVHQAIERVTADLEEGPHFNTAISTIMELVNHTQQFNPGLGDLSARRVLREALEAIVRLLAPFAPHLCEELRQDLMSPGIEPLVNAAWPAADPQALCLDVVNIVVQINGKRRASISLSSAISGEELEQAVLKDPRAKRYLEGGKITQTIVVPGRLVNFVME